MVQCCAFGCNKPGKYYFPKDPKLSRRWESALKRDGFKATHHSRLCPDHFKPDDFCEKEGYYSGLKRIVLREGAFPSVFIFDKEPSATAVRRRERAAKRDAKRKLFEKAPDPNVSDCTASICVPASQETSEEIPQIIEEVAVKSEVFEVSEPMVEVHQPIKKIATASASTQKDYQLYSVESFRNDDFGIHYYTGLESVNKFHYVLSTLSPEAYRLKYRYNNVLNLSVQDQFLLTLMKLRKNKDDYELTRFFGVSNVTVSNVFVTWINFMHQMWSLLDIWPSRELVDFFMPEGFRKYYPSTRVIVDCTEVPINKPKNPSAQQAVFSHYKNRCTCKFEVGSTPSGLLCHCSKGYGGSTSDRQILERNGLLDKCERKDSVMADRGFNVQDLFAPKGVSVNIPEFLKGKSQLPGLTLLQDRKLASKRVHIERLIGLLKTYEILQTPMNGFYVPLCSKIFFVCFMLCNFREGIVSKKA